MLLRELHGGVAMEVERNGCNRFCVVVKSEQEADDLDWAAVLFWLNYVLETHDGGAFSGFDAYLEDVE